GGWLARSGLVPLGYLGDAAKTASSAGRIGINRFRAGILVLTEGQPAGMDQAQLRPIVASNRQAKNPA
ncbi:hypothetical protein, partial [Bradyrhizobium sp.]|uniref:hypothetical protein n=1 Tax=Bradyrhizobium sp. TaxID=376 RepID=UPI0027349703